MSQQSKTTLQSAINSQIADNTSGNITAADIRNNLINTTDSLVFNTGSQAITGSLNVTGGITGSLFGTASRAVNAINATTAATASYISGTTIKVYGSYQEESGAFNFPTTASFIGYIVPIPVVQPYYSIDLTIQTWGESGVIPIVIRLYASTSSAYTTNVASDVLIGTYSASIGSISREQVYRIKRSFHQTAIGSSEPDQISYGLWGANPTASILSDESINDIYRSNLGIDDFSGTPYVPYSFLKILGQTNAGAFYSYTYAFGPLRVTYQQ